DRDTGDGVKVGGHQASSASLVTVMTALYFAHLDAPDKVSVKPHASPAFHAIQYLLGNLDRSYLPTLRAFGGLQSYPSRTKDPDLVDFSTGSVGLGAAAPLFAAATRRYVDAHFGARPGSRFVALIGAAELDEVRDLCAGIASDAELADLVTDLAGHDFRSLLAAFGECDAEKDRPSVLFAYTVKGWGLPIAGNPRNHSALLSTAQIDQMRERL